MEADSPLFRRRGTRFNESPFPQEFASGPVASEEFAGLFDLVFPAKVTAVNAGAGSYSGSWIYDWKEQDTDKTTGAYSDKPNGRTGTHTGPKAPAFEVNNRKLPAASLPTFVWMRSKAISSDDLTYEFEDPAAPSGSQPTFNPGEVPGGTPNGVLTTFTLVGTPSPSGSLTVYVNGVMQTPTTHYSVTGNTITFTTPPPTGSKLLAGPYQTSAGSGTVTGQTLTYTSDTLDLVGSTLSLDSASTLDIAGAAVDVTASTTVTVSGGATLTVTGGSATADLSGLSQVKLPSNTTVGGAAAGLRIRGPFAITYTDFSVAGAGHPNYSKQLFALAAGELPLAAWFDITTAWNGTGGGIFLQVGLNATGDALSTGTQRSFGGSNDLTGLAANQDSPGGFAANRFSGPLGGGTIADSNLTGDGSGYPSVRVQMGDSGGDVAHFTAGAAKVWVLTALSP